MMDRIGLLTNIAFWEYLASVCFDCFFLQYYSYYCSTWSLPLPFMNSWLHFQPTFSAPISTYIFSSNINLPFIMHYRTQFIDILSRRSYIYPPYLVHGRLSSSVSYASYHLKTDNGHCNLEDLKKTQKTKNQFF